MEKRGGNEVRAFLEARGLRREIYPFGESLHNSELAAKQLGVEVGATSPVALPAGIPLYQDLSLRRFETIYPAAG